MLQKPHTIEELADAIERYSIKDGISDYEFDAINLAVLSLRMAACAAPEFMQLILRKAVALSRQAEIFAARANQSTTKH